MSFSKVASVLVTASVLTACANTGAAYRPIVDGPRAAGFEVDLGECQDLARERKLMNGDTKTQAALGAVLGAVVGLADDDVSDTEGIVGGAIAGAAAGSVSGSVDAQGDRKEIVIQCMRGRGHKVVG